MLVFGERGKPENPGKTLSEQSGETTNSHTTCDDRSRNLRRAILKEQKFGFIKRVVKGEITTVKDLESILKEGECFHHCANPA